MPDPTKRAAAKKAEPAPEVARLPHRKFTPEDLEDQPRLSYLWDKLTEPFPSDWVEKLPKPLKGKDDDKGRCQQGTRYSADGHFCGGWHARSVHLDYVGHAGITMRLNDVLGPEGWDFQPLAKTPEGLPIITQSTFYGALTIMGVTKWDVAANYSGPQEALGDCLRRCASRFGIGTYLWAKSEHAAQLAAFQEPEPEREAERPAAPGAGDQAPPPEVPPHVQQVYDILSTLTDSQKTRMANWWDHRAQAGALPLRANIAALTPQQTAVVEDFAMEMVEADHKAHLAAQGAPDPQ